MSKTLSPNEIIKAKSKHLRGTLQASLADQLSSGLHADDQVVIKFHGSYQQDNRDIREERCLQKLEPAFDFMLRARLPGGICTPAQWLALDDIAERYGNGSLRLTTRQTFQVHGVVKASLKPTMQALHRSLLDTLAACGDVNRNVICTSAPQNASLHAQVLPYAQRLSAAFLPQSGAYAEIWLDQELVAGGEPHGSGVAQSTPRETRRGESSGPAPDERGRESPLEIAEPEPLYGTQYLPRKFKMAVAIPPDNDVDVYAQCLGFVAIADGDQLVGFNVTVGGGMGATHNDATAFPRVADTIGFCLPEQVEDVARAVLIVQRDYGNREVRKHARLKYTIAHRGLPWFMTTLHQQLGFELAPPREVTLTSNNDRFGWQTRSDGTSSYTLHVESGRIAGPLKTCLREIAAIHDGEFRLTANQNVIISGISATNQAAIEKLLSLHHHEASSHAPVRRLALACVALPTCSLAMAEAERVLGQYTEKLTELLRKHGLAEEPLHFRITGCPNGCARPYLAELALIGKAPGRYNLMVGGNASGTRLAYLLRENLDEESLWSEIDAQFAAFAASRVPNERFGDFADRTKAL